MTNGLVVVISVPKFSVIACSPGKLTDGLVVVILVTISPVIVAVTKADERFLFHS